MSEYPAIRAYLDELAKELAARSPECDRMLKEAEDHLLEAAGQLRADGMAATDAERAAVARFGAPPEVADRWAAGRKPESFAKVRWWTAVPLAAALLSFAVATLFVGYRGSDRRAATSAETSAPAKAFTAVKVETLYSESGEVRSSSTQTEAFRSDGSEYSASRRRNGGLMEWAVAPELVSIWDPTKRITAMVLPGRGLVSSQPMPAFSLRKWRSTPAKMCSYLLDALDLDPNSATGEILGYRVRQHTFGPEGRQEVWVAPDLDCYELRSTNWHIDSGTGKRYAALISEVIFIAEGEPRAEYFAIPAGFRESPPSEIFRSAWQAMGHQTADHNRQFYQRADEQYYRIRSDRDERQAGAIR